MTKTQHTPGPWSAVPMVNGAKGAYYIVGNRNGNNAEVELAQVGPTLSPHADANARLIAAAPDFAETAPDAADILEHYAEYVRGLPSTEFERHPYIPAIEEAAAKLRAAILKATGEQA